MRKPAVVAHCDWSKQEDKRWMAVAVRRNAGWTLNAPETVGETSSLLERLRLRKEAPGSLLVGFDFPIGLPAKYASKLNGLSDFRHALREFGTGCWSKWYDVAECEREISIRRPFYPMRPGGRKQAHLLGGLGISDKDQLLRRCEKKTDLRPAACMLFWTLGGNQVGKAAISGWRQVIAPNLDLVDLWPFDGSLHNLLEKERTIIAETYPGEVYRQLEFPRSKWSKRKPEGRRHVAGHLRHWLETRPVATDEGLRQTIEQGFAPRPEGEDQFDAMVGLFGMLDVVEGRREEGAPNTSDIGKWEGWILGQTAERENPRGAVVMTANI